MKINSLYFLFLWLFVVASPSSARKNTGTASSVIQQHGHRRPLSNHELAVISQTTHNNSPAVESDSRAFLNTVVCVATLNLIINLTRPDPSVVWQFRFPRMLWEICIMVTATTASASPNTSRAPSMIFLLLALMLGSTALVDIFWWAPFFAILSGIDGNDCSGGFFSGRPYVCTPNHAKGYGRLLVTLQSLFGGMIYLSSAIQSWCEYNDRRERRKVDHQAHAFREWQQLNQNMALEQ